MVPSPRARPLAEAPRRVSAAGSAQARWRPAAPVSPQLKFSEWFLRNAGTPPQRYLHGEAWVAVCPHPLPVTPLSSPPPRHPQVLLQTKSCPCPCPCWGPRTELVQRERRPPTPGRALGVFLGPCLLCENTGPWDTASGLPVMRSARPTEWAVVCQQGIQASLPISPAAAAKSTGSHELCQDQWGAGSSPIQGTQSLRWHCPLPPGSPGCVLQARKGPHLAEHPLSGSFPGPSQVLSPDVRVS